MVITPAQTLYDLQSTYIQLVQIIVNFRKIVYFLSVEKCTSVSFWNSFSFSFIFTIWWYLIFHFFCFRAKFGISEIENDDKWYLYIDETHLHIKVKKHQKHEVQCKTTITNRSTDLPYVCMYLCICMYVCTYILTF